MLLFYKKRGELVKATFNGHTFYSDTVTLDNAYTEVTGKTKTEYDKEMQERHKKYRQEEKDYKRKIPELTKEWITKGHEILDKKYWKNWDKIVPLRLKDLYRGMELGACLSIIETLNNNSEFYDAKYILDKQNHSGASYNLVVYLVSNFCDRGTEFKNFLEK